MYSLDSLANKLRGKKYACGIPKNILKIGKGIVNFKLSNVCKIKIMMILKKKHHKT